MKIGGPKNVKPELPSAPEKPQRATPGDSPHFSKALGLEPGSVAKALPADALADVTQQLKAGQITAEQATELLIEAVVRAKAGLLTPLIQEKLRSSLSQLIAEDPYLSAQIARLKHIKE